MRRSAKMLFIVAGLALAVVLAPGIYKDGSRRGSWAPWAKPTTEECRDDLRAKGRFSSAEWQACARG